MTSSTVPSFSLSEASKHTANGAATSGGAHMPRITILPATSPAFPALATADLLAFSGASGEPTSILISPLRRDLLRSGAHPRHWPDFQGSIDSLQKGVRDGKVMVMAVVEDAAAPAPREGSSMLYGRGEQSKGSITINGVTGVAAGLAKLHPPAHVHRALLSSRSTADRLWNDYVSPTFKKAKQTVFGDDATGTDFNFLSLFKENLETVRKETTSDGDWLLELLFVHPAYQGYGVARALLLHCQALAESVDPFAFLLPSPYTHKSLSQPKQVQPQAGPSISSPEARRAPNTPLDTNTISDDPESQPEGSYSQNLKPVRMIVRASQAGTPVYARLGFRHMYKSSVVYKGEEVSWPVMAWEGLVSG